MDKRPVLDNHISSKDFQDFYWLKEELIQFCREEGLKTTGSKIAISQRIIHYLKTGQKELNQSSKKTKTTSKFNWQKEQLSLDTQITDNYKNTTNVRTFFQEKIGSYFKFNVQFMNWMKANNGKSLGDAVQAWKHIQLERKNTSIPKDIAPQFEYNTYLRDFLADNPNANRAAGIQLWKIKKSMRGHNKYENGDLKWLKDK